MAKEAALHWPWYDNQLAEYGMALTPDVLKKPKLC